MFTPLMESPFWCLPGVFEVAVQHTNTSIGIQEKNAVRALFSEVRCANKQDRHKDKSNTCEYTRAKENAMFIVALFSNKRTQKLFSAFFLMWENSLRSRRRLEGRAALSLTSRRCFFRFPLFSFISRFFCSIHPRCSSGEVFSD